MSSVDARPAVGRRTATTVGRRPASTAGRRSAARLAAASALLLPVLAGCSGLGQPEAAGSQRGYVAGDGSVLQVAVDERDAPVVLEGESTDGAPVSTAAWAGEVVVVNFWYAGCAPCRAEAPDLAAAAEGAADGVQFVGVNVRDDAATAAAFERTFAIEYPSLLDADSGENVVALAGLVSPQSIPSTIVLDREGRPAARVLGQVDPSVLQGLVDDAVAEAPA